MGAKVATYQSNVILGCSRNTFGSFTIQRLKCMEWTNGDQDEGDR